MIKQDEMEDISLQCYSDNQNEAVNPKTIEQFMARGKKI